MRLIGWKDNARLGAQLRITDDDGLRLTCISINTSGLPIAERGLRRRLRARAEECIRPRRN